MGLASLSSEAVPSQVFTPQDPLVESLRIALSRNCTFVLSKPLDKTFLFTWIVKEYARHVKNGTGSIVIFVANADQADLWSKFFHRTTNLHPVTDLSGEDESKQSVFAVISPTLMSESLTARIEKINVRLAVIDNSHLLLDADNETYGLFKPIFEQLKTNRSARIVTFTTNVIDGTKDSEVKSIDVKFDELVKTYPSKVESCSELLSLLRFMVDPVTSVVKYKAPQDPEEVQNIVESLVLKCREVLEDHRYSLLDIYGEEFSDLISDIPDPKTLPLRLLDDFLLTLRTYGVWCADRAALVLTVKIEKLKTKEKYERHYLILGYLYTEMLRIRRVFEEAFGTMPEREKQITYSTPKVRLVKS